MIRIKAGVADPVQARVRPATDGGALGASLPVRAAVSYSEGKGDCRELG